MIGAGGTVKPQPRWDFPLRFLALANDEDAEVRAHFAGIGGVRLDDLLTIPFVPAIPDRARAWPPPRLDREPRDPREARLVTIASHLLAVVGDDAEAGREELVPGGRGADGEELPGTLVRFVSNAELAAYLAEIERAIAEGARAVARWFDAADRRVVRFVRNEVLESPRLPARIRRMILPDNAVAPRPELACPRCASHRVKVGEIAVGGGAMLDRWCEACHLLEERADDAPDLAAWRRRWEARRP